MFLNYLSELLAPTRTSRGDLHLGVALSFIAGAVNAGGFLAIGQYTSHMTGLLSTATDSLVLGQNLVAVAALVSIFSFVAGAMCTSLLVSYTKRNHPTLAYVPTLAIEALLLLLFGSLGPDLHKHQFVHVSLTVTLLCFIMGLQNALITRVSEARIRTTHVTGLLTDMGIELGKILYWRTIKRNPANAHLKDTTDTNLRKLGVHCSLVLSFFIGGLTGALGFSYLGFVSVIPLTGVLFIICAASILRPHHQLNA